MPESTLAVLATQLLAIERFIEQISTNIEHSPPLSPKDLQLLNALQSSYLRTRNQLQDTMTDIGVE